MKIKTGITVYDIMVSVDSDNQPVSGATFTSNFYLDGQNYNGITPTITLNNYSAATFSISWSASTFGFHQLHIKNNVTSTIYMSDIFNVRPDNEVDASFTIYTGL